MVQASDVQVGMRIEVVQQEAGLVGSRYAGHVVQLRGRRTKAEALVEYETLFDDAEETAGERAMDGEQGAGDGEGARLREWVPLSTLAPPPPPSPPLWHRQIRPNDEAQLWHEGGWWRVVVEARLLSNVRLGEPMRFAVRALGYDVRRTVDAKDLRRSEGTEA